MEPHPIRRHARHHLGRNRGEPMPGEIECKLRSWPQFSGVFSPGMNLSKRSPSPICSLSGLRILG